MLIHGINKTEQKFKIIKQQKGIDEQQMTEYILISFIRIYKCNYKYSAFQSSLVLECCFFALSIHSSVNIPPFLLPFPFLPSPPSLVLIIIYKHNVIQVAFFD